jgi:hypothetical protein
MKLNYYNSVAAAEESRRERALRRASNVWRRWQRQFERYRHPAVSPDHSIVFLAFWGGLVVILFVFLLAMIVYNANSIPRWIDPWF